MHSCNNKWTAFGLAELVCIAVGKPDTNPTDRTMNTGPSLAVGGAFEHPIRLLRVKLDRNEIGDVWRKMKCSHDE